MSIIEEMTKWDSTRKVLVVDTGFNSMDTMSVKGSLSPEGIVYRTD